MKVPEELIKLIGRERKFFIATHINPEGDALGASIAFSMALESIGKETTLYDRDPVPEIYRFLPGHERFTNAGFPQTFAGQTVVLLDCNEPARAGLDTAVIPFSAVIDHHETEKEFGTVRWIEPKAAATGVMVYHLMEKLGVKISKEMATNLYTAIAIDTGTFRYSNVTSDVLRAAAELVDAGADPGAIATGLYETWSRGKFLLLIEVLNTLEISGAVAMTVATRDMFSRTGTSGEDTENFSNMPRKMRDIQVSAFFREVEGGWKVSLRSRGEVNVAQAAARFGGGGSQKRCGLQDGGRHRDGKEETG